MRPAYFKRRHANGNGTDRRRWASLARPIEPLEPVSFEEVQRRTCAAIEAHADNYCHFTAEEEWETAIEPLLAEVKRTRKIADIYDLLQPDTFEPC